MIAIVLGMIGLFVGGVMMVGNAARQPQCRHESPAGFECQREEGHEQLHRRIIGNAFDRDVITWEPDGEKECDDH